MQILNLQRHKTTLAIISFVWAALNAAHILFLHHLANLSVSISFADSLVFNILFTIFGLGVVMATEFSDAINPFARRIVFLYLPMLVLISILWLLASYTLLNTIIEDENYRKFLVMSLKYRALIGVLLFSIVIIIQQLIHYYRNYQQKQLKTTKLENELQRSKVDALQMQMQPHFLFNALNSISSLTFEDAQRTRKMLIKLSEFLRYTTKYTEKQLVQLNDELLHIDQYLSIEHLRFGERLVYERNVTDDALTRFLPCLVLQPVIENAIKHGVNQSIDPVTIKLDAHIEGSNLVIVISNTKQGESRKNGTGTGLKNLSNRLKILYSDRAKLKIENQPTLFIVRIIIP